MTVKVITDSTSYLDPEYIKKEDISVVPLNYIFGGVESKEGLKGSFEDFYRELESSTDFPTTSQPSAGDFLNAYNDALRDYDEAIVIVLSSKISGTYNSATTAGTMLEDKKVTIVDSTVAAAALKFLVEDAVEMSKQGMDAASIAKVLDEQKEKMEVLLTPESLEYLTRGGRMSTLKSSIGKLLNIKPIIRLIDGELKLEEKARGRKKAIARLIELVRPEVKRIGVCHILDLEEAQLVTKTLKEKFPKAVITFEDLGPVIGSHLGPKTIGLCIYY
ncbi:MAG: DegV family protein [Gudongella sp.]|jgi:DegV family protein with EDD domain|nr:DegV family protein [Gudongella sp.]